ncbi:BadF/BadG/BcrA/BcrD ATPase family protein [Gordonibacter urolithinfaciens]|uniref:BadF/BadG/BcrA/BcrD ATPase family protein n=1 Tax=Gordonibacter urolithinfaciens TaxID=1335613 RepID=UPI003AAFD468
MASIGIDIGSKTIKVVVLDGEGAVVHSVYRRHRADVASTLAGALHELTWRFGDIEGTVGVTGSAGIGISGLLGLPFVQEVVATTTAVRREYPQADAIVELGGEDAKLVYLTRGLEQRMNATCAGGTGGFIDTVAFMLGLKTAELSKLALGANRVYPIASRCAVFAQTDIRPLLNAGARAADIAASALEAVVRQTLGGLACGRPIEGTVVFLGGPLEHIPELVRRFRSALGLTAREGIKPLDAHLFTARGAALHGAEAFGERGDADVSLVALEERLARLASFADDFPRLPRLFASEGELAAFRRRHASCTMPRTRLFDCEGPLYLGLDAGSTAVKLAVLDEAGRLAYADCRPPGGEVLETAIAMLRDFHAVVPRAVDGTPYAYVAHATACGYGEDLIRAGLGFDSGVVETLAHVRAARSFSPDLTFLLDIGGQDMKAVWVRDGRVLNAVLNEACSSGCGSFVEGTAHSLRSTPEEFSEKALLAESPVDLGTKCTVFMSSRVRHAQKSGVAVEDIAAGIACSVVRNALFRIIGLDRLDSLGDCVVVQGGTFMSDAVLRAFELVSGKEVVRLDTAHLMGAIGAALTARERAHAAAREGACAVRSGLASRKELDRLFPARSSRRCGGCGNGCLLSVVDFGGGRQFVSGNRCDRAHGIVEARRGSSARGGRRPPNAVALERKLLAKFSGSEGSGPRARLRVGIVNALAGHAQMPFWHTVIAALGFSVAVPDDGRAEESGAAREGAATIPSESVCHPAKLAHMRLYDLVRSARADAVFMPCYVRGRKCPVACGYAAAVADCAPLLRDGGAMLVSPMLRTVNPAALADDADDRAALLASLNVAAATAGLPAVADGELAAAIAAGLAVQREFERTVGEANRRALAWAHGAGRRGAVLAGRPYHVDPAVMHGIDGVLTSLGFAVLSPTALDAPCEELGEEAGLAWERPARLERLAGLVLADPAIELVCLQSFGCAYDAAVLPVVRAALEAAGRPFTSLKVDGIVDTAPIRIRLRTLAEACEGGSAYRADGERYRIALPVSPERGCGTSAHWSLLGPMGRADVDAASGVVPDDICFVARVLAGRLIRMARDGGSLDVVEMPEVCEKCLLAAVPGLAGCAVGHRFAVRWSRVWRIPSSPGVDEGACRAPGRPRIGLVGNALMVFEPFMNDGIAELIEGGGCEAVLPRPEGLMTDDVRYLPEFDRFAQLGVDHVIYLQALGCLKGHVRARGALHELAGRYPGMPVTVIDYEPEASALNRENRALLAIAAAKEAFADRGL